MRSIKKIIQHLFTFITGILVLGYKIIKQVILPSGGKKGNLLSSLFTFMVGVLEGLIQFERNLLKAPMLFRNKYIRQGLQIAAAIFLFIGSLEWSATAAPAGNQSTLQSVQNISQPTVRKNKKCQSGQLPTQICALPSNTRTVTFPARAVSSQAKKYLLICCFRI